MLLRSAEQVLALRPDAAVLAGLDVGVVGATDAATGDEAIAFEVRAFLPGHSGLMEDPLTTPRHE